MARICSNPECGASNSDQARFCHQCGQPLADEPAVLPDAETSVVKKATTVETAHLPARSNEMSRGLGVISSLVVMVAFFLPWIQACGVEMSGYQIASDQSGLIANNWIYWLTPLAGIGCLLLSFTAAGQKTAATVRLMLAGIGVLPLLNIMANLSRMAGGQASQTTRAIWDTIRIGGWLTLAGLAGVIISAWIDLTTKPPEEMDSG